MDQSEILERLLSLLNEHHKSQKQDKFVAYNDPHELAEILELKKSDNAGNWSEIFSWIEKYLKYSVKTGHPGFLNRMWEGANLPSVLGEIVAAASNTSSCTYESAPVSTLMEKYMLDQMIELVGFTSGEGQMTTGSSNANLLAMMAARNEHLEEVKTQGLYNQKKLYAFVSADAHYSLEKAANVLGLGTHHLIKIPVNYMGEMDLSVLQERIKQTIENDGIPFFVAGTSGTTVRGAYDSIAELVELRDTYSFWLHIDGAWGGAVLVSDMLREKFMKGVGEVDSLTWDFHKMLGTALMCNVFLINNRLHTLGKVCSGGDDSYLFHTNGGNSVQDLGAVSLQCGRRVDSLKWFLDWKFFGRKGFAKRVESAFELCCYAEQALSAIDELELVVPRNSFNICFRYRSKIEGVNTDQLNLAIRQKLHHEGISLVGYAYHDNRPFLRLLLANHDLSNSDIDNYFKQVVCAGKYLEEKFYDSEYRCIKSI
jgi:glutamate/tyrosine decarboxylase-like PLP-dependent enzyme